MPLLHPGAPFPELSLTVPGRATEADVQVAALSVDDEATTTGGTRLRLEPGQAVIPHGIDHDLTTGEMHPREQR
jgi:hypothetical protein